RPSRRSSDDRSRSCDHALAAILETRISNRPRLCGSGRTIPRNRYAAVGFRGPAKSQTRGIPACTSVDRCCRVARVVVADTAVGGSCFPDVARHQDRDEGRVEIAGQDNRLVLRDSFSPSADTDSLRTACISPGEKSRTPPAIDRIQGVDAVSVQLADLETVEVIADPIVRRSAPRVLLAAYQCGPGMGSVSQIGWEWYSRLSRRVAVTLITHIRNREALEAAGAPFNDSEIIYIDTEWFAGPLYRLAKKIFPASEHSVFLV